MINTVLGAISARELGVTLTHEHMVVRTEAVVAHFPHLYDIAGERRRAVAQIRLAQSHGVRTVCDPSVVGLGRDVQFIRDLAVETGLQVVVASGLYTFDELPRYFQMRSVDDLAAAFTEEADRGIQGTGIKPGFFKCATDLPGFTPGVEKAIRAVARAHQATGLPIMTHSCPANRSGLRQLDIFEEEGVDPRCVLVGHSGDTSDLDYLTAVADRGAYLGMDRFGIDDTLPSANRTRVVFELWDRGYGGHLLLSHDHPCTYDRLEPPYVVAARREWHWGHLFEKVLPRLVELGMPQEAINGLMIDNARNWMTSG